MCDVKEPPRDPEIGKIFRENNNVMTDDDSLKIQNLLLENITTWKALSLLEYDNLYHSHSIHPSSSLKNAITLLASFKYKCYRLFSVDINEEDHGIISQRLLINFLFENIDIIEKYENRRKKKVFANNKEKTIAYHFIKDKHLKYLPINSCALSAFVLFSIHNLRCLPITTSNRTLVGSISVSDFPSNEEEMRIINLPAVEYLTRIRRFCEPEVIHPFSTLKDIITAFYNSQVHHLYVVPDPEHKTVLGVISITDVLRYLVNDIVN